MTNNRKSHTRPSGAPGSPPSNEPSRIPLRFSDVRNRDTEQHTEQAVKAPPDEALQAAHALCLCVAEVANRVVRARVPRSRAEALAEDVRQDACVRVLERAHSGVFSIPQLPTAYAVATVSRTLSNALRAPAERHAHAEFDETHDATETDVGDLPDHALDARERANQLAAMIARLDQLAEEPSARGSVARALRAKIAAGLDPTLSTSDARTIGCGRTRLFALRDEVLRDLRDHLLLASLDPANDNAR